MKRLRQQDYLTLREGADVLEGDANGDKVLRLVDGTILKLFRRRRRISSAALYPYAQRFANNAKVLERLGVPVPKVIDVLRIPSIERDAVRYVPLAGETLREMRRVGLSQERSDALKAAFTRFVVNLHNRGVYFRSLHLGNVVCTPDGTLGLIDFSDLRVHPWALGKYLRARNLRRMQEQIEDCNWVDFDAIANGLLPAADSRR